MSRKLVAIKLLPPSIARLDSAADRLSRSRAATVELLISLYADDLTANTMIPASAVPPGARKPGQKRSKINPKKSINSP